MARTSADNDAHQRSSATERTAQQVFVSRSKGEQPADQNSVVLSGLSVLEQLIRNLLQHSTEEAEILRRTCQALVEVAGYAGALVVTLEDQQQLRLRAAALRLPPHANGDLLLQPLNRLLQSGEPLVRLDEAGHACHLAVRALATSRDGGALVASDRLHDLLGPLLTAEEAKRAGRLARVARVLALPFSVQDRVWGCLLLMSHHEQFAPGEKQLLTTLTQQMALGVRNARLYQRVEEQRRAAHTFARMAFSASAYLHTLRNQIGSFRTYLDLVQMLPQMPPEQQTDVINSGRKAYDSLDQAAEILDHLHEPWQQHPHTATDINDCLAMALLKVFPKMQAEPRTEPFTDHRGITVHRALASSLPTVHTSPDMLTEVFRIAIRNAVDAVEERPDVPGALWLETSAGAETVCVTIRDNGAGIASSDIELIFELGWSTKEGQGMGFGLFWAKSFVEGLGGHIEVDSKPQQGTAFHFMLPTADG